MREHSRRRWRHERILQVSIRCKPGITLRSIDDRPACRDFIERLRDAGRGSPYEGATEMTIAHTYDAAGKAGCVKSS